MADASSIAGYIKDRLEDSFYYSNNIYYNTGNVGIGTATVNNILQVGGGGRLRIANSSSDYSMIGTSDNDGSTNAKIVVIGNTYGSGLSGGIDYYTTGTGNYRFFTTDSATERMRITSTGNVGIGTATVNNILQVGSGGRLRISNGTSDYTLIGTNETDGATNTRIVISGNVRGGSPGEITYIATSTGSHVFNTTDSGTERMRITSGGNVGIGTNNPNAKLNLITSHDDVNSSFRIDSSAGLDVYSLTIWSYFVTSNAIGWRFRIKSQLGGDNTAIQISNTGSVYFPIGSSSASDSRIKKDIEDINDESALNKLLLIQPTTYNYIDVERNKGFGKVYGFIAQQIREVIPEAITIIVKEVIPNIYKRCLINNKREVYHSIPLDTPIDTSVKIDDTLYKIKEVHEGYFVIDNDIDTDDAFVFGYSVNDFHTLDKTYIFTLNVCATQELHRRIEAQSVLLKSQDDRIRDLETKVAMLLSSNTT